MNFFVYKDSESKRFFFGGGGGKGGERDSVARVSEFFLQRIQI